MSARFGKSVAAGLCCLSTAACQLFEPSGSEDSVEVSVNGTPGGVVLTSFLDDLTGNGGRTRREVMIGSSVRYSGLVTGFDVSVGLEDAASQDCVGLDSAGIETTVAPVLLTTGSTSRVTFDVICHAGVIDLRVTGLPSANISVPIILDDSASVHGISRRSIPTRQNQSAKVHWSARDNVVIRPERYTDIISSTVYVAPIQQINVTRGDTAAVSIVYRDSTTSACVGQLRAWYPLNASAADASGNGVHGTVRGAIVTSNRHGDEAAAFAFDGIDDSIELGDAFNSLALPFSIAAWVYQPAAARGDLRSILVTDDEPGRYAGIWFQIEPSGAPAITYADGGSVGGATRRTLSANSPISTDTWTHVAATVRGPTDMTIYVNGAAVPGTYSGSGGPLQHTSAPARIGNMSIVPGNRPWRGRLDELRIYSCNLEANDVAALFTQR